VRAIVLLFLICHVLDARTIKGTKYNRFTSSVWTEGRSFHFEDLKPVKNPNPYPEPQPDVLRPEFILSDKDVGKAWITLSGSLTKPGKEVSILDLRTLREIKRVSVGLKPIFMAMHPNKKFLLVVNELSNYLSVIDTQTDSVISRIPADFYCQSVLIHPDGKQVFASIQYLSQVLPIQLNLGLNAPRGTVKHLPGFSKKTFADGPDSVHKILRARCQRCHNESAGGFLVNQDVDTSYLSAIENSTPSQPENSVLLRAVLSNTEGGFANQNTGGEFHAGGVVFTKDEKDFQIVSEWIRNASDGPGINVGNPHSMPRRMVLSEDSRYLITNNTGTNDLSIIDLNHLKDIGGIFLQGLTHSVIPLTHPLTREQSLLMLGLGAGFGAPKSRDPLGAETWDPSQEASQFTVLRDLVSTDAYEIKNQFVMGPFDAVDGTWNFKMRDIQNDLVWIDFNKLSLPQNPPVTLPYYLMANTYEDHPHWVRYTSDTAEATHGDIKGDYPVELMRVHGSFPDTAIQIGDYVYITMRASFEVVEYKIHWETKEAYQKLEPTRVFRTNLLPTGLAEGLNKTILAVNSYHDSLQVIDLDSGKSSTIYPFGPKKDTMQSKAAKGDLIFRSSKLTSDGDTSCFHCHYRDNGDGRPWGAAEAIAQDRNGHFFAGGTLGIPQVRSLYGNEPFYFEGTHLFVEGQGADINEPASSIDFLAPVAGGDYTHIKHPMPEEQRPLMHEELKERVTVHKLGNLWWDLEERRSAFLKDRTREIFSQEYSLKELYEFMGTFMGNDSYLPPNPYDREQSTFLRGQELFFSPQVMCSVCHAPPNFTNKSPVLANNPRRALPQLTTMTRRDASYTLVSVNAMEHVNNRFIGIDTEDIGRIEDIEGSFTTMQLRGIFDRPPVFLHHGRAKNLREVLLTPLHSGRKPYRYPVYLGLEIVRKDGLETGFNETRLRLEHGPLDQDTQTVDTHGGTSHLSSKEIDDLLHFMLGIP